MSKPDLPATVEQFVARFRENYVPVDLIRVGGDADGGYLVPDVLDRLDYCFSPGVADTADFERDLGRDFGIRSFLADASVPGPPFEDEKFHFTPKFLGSRSSGDFITLGDWMQETVGDSDAGMILQMDIEGGEYEVLTCEPDDTLRRFAVMVIEFHWLDRLADPLFRQRIATIFEKIYRNFSICHVHPNNCCGTLMVDGVEVPRVMEVTFLRHDLARELRTDAPISLPHTLDRRNLQDRADIAMPALWWRGTAQPPPPSPSPSRPSPSSSPSSPPAGKPSICLNMIVRNEAHVITELIDSVAPHIQHWVIVDTGSDDGTQDKIRSYMAELGIPGELHERPWRNFGHNRSEALQLAQGRADYIWVMDADDILVGDIDLSNLSADVYQMRIESPMVSYWRRQIFRDGVPWRYEGVVHEFAKCDVPHTDQRLQGQYIVQSRRVGGRNLDPEKYRRDIALLSAELERNPDDSRSVFYIARSYNSLADWANAREWYLRRAAMGGWQEEVFYSLWRAATAMDKLGEPWPQVQDALLRAWESRPSRAEPLYDIAMHYRQAGRYTLGHLFAQRAAAIPLPPEDSLFINPEVYRFRALDEQAVCASWIGRRSEAMELCDRLLALPDLPEDDRARIAANRDLMARAGTK